MGKGLSFPAGACYNGGTMERRSFLMLKATFKIAKVIGIVLLVLLLLIVLLVVLIATAPSVPNRYTRTVETGGEGSVFYGKVDLENIGISGHSQGGVGVFNAVTDNAHSGLYKTAVALSPTQEEGAAALGMPYDLTKVEIPVLMLAGTQGEFETEMVLPLDAMTAMYDRLSVPKAMARRTDSDHGGMLYKADGYVTAWLLWQLQGNEEAGKAFTGESPELTRNALYQDARVDLEA